MQIRISENGITLYASASRGTIIVEMLILEWRHPVGPCQWKVDQFVLLPEARTRLSKRLTEVDPNPDAESERQVVIARALALLNWVETAPQSIPVTSLQPKSDVADQPTV
jgi:hypothetical protein